MIIFTELAKAHFGAPFDDELFLLQTPIDSQFGCLALLVRITLMYYATITTNEFFADLQHVNYSYNPMINIDPIQLAPMCSLKTIDLKGTNMPGCACKSIEFHLHTASVFIKNGPIHCDRNGPECTITGGNATQQLHMECMTNKQSRIQEEMKSSILIYAAIGGGSLLAILLICGCFIRNKKVSANRKKEKRAAAARRKARRMDDEHLLMIKAEQNNQVEKCTKNDSNVIQVDVEKVPPIHWKKY